MPKMICICILLIYFKVISKKGGHYCPRLPYVSCVTCICVVDHLIFCMYFALRQSILSDFVAILSPGVGQVTG